MSLVAISVIVFSLAFGGGIFVCATSATVAAVADATANRFPLMLDLTMFLVGLAVLFGSIYLAIALWQRWIDRHLIYPDVQGNTPLVKDDDYVNHTPKEVQIIGAITKGAKVSNATARDLLMVYMQQAGLSPEPLAGEWDVLPPEPRMLPRGALSVYDAPLPIDPALLVGEDIDTGVQIWFKLHNMGTCIIGGLSGYGKSETMAAMMATVMLQSPDGRIAQIAVVDTKKVDFGLMPDNAAVMFAPVATDEDKGLALVQALLAEMERRFALLKATASRSLRGYNDKVSEAEKLPYIVLFVDELADWMNDKEFNKIILKFGRQGRAAGMNQILATQRPSADVVNSSIRALAAQAIALRVKNYHDSITIIDQKGAEDLPTGVKGRCLVWNGELHKVQSYYAGIEEERFDAFTRTLPSKDAVVNDEWRDKPTNGGVQPWATATGAQPVVSPPVAADPSVQPLQKGRKPSPEIATTMRRLYAGGMSKTRICHRYWNYKDGVVFQHLNDALEHRI